jgi:hypothetical protein
MIRYDLFHKDRAAYDKSKEEIQCDWRMVPLLRLDVVRQKHV